MTPERREMVQAWVDEWKVRGAFLEKIRRQEIRDTDTQQAFRAFAGLATYYIERRPKTTSSGLEEFYRKLGNDRTL